MGTPPFHQTMQRKQQQQEVIKELVQGQQFAAQLQLLFQKNQYSCSPAANELVPKILTSFTRAISALAAAAADSGDNQDSSASGMYEDSGESQKRRPAGKDNRGSYKRRKSGQSNVIISPSIQDGQAWRKYGQKEILNAKFPRSYFRCSHKYDQGCKATKHVQRLDQESTELYSITYVGNHTCSGGNVPKAVMSVPINGRENETELSLVTNVKQEGCMVMRKDDINNEQSMSEVTNDHDTNMWQDLVPLEPEETISNYGYDYCGYSTGAAASISQISDLDFLVKNVVFESELGFD